MIKNTLEQFTPETENIIQWVNAFNYEEELNKINKYDNIKITKSGIKISDFFEAVETAPKPTTQQPTKQNIKTVQKIKIEEDEELKIRYVNYKEIKEYSLDINNKYLPISKQVKNGYIYSLIPIEKKKQFINQYLKTNNNYMKS